MKNTLQSKLRQTFKYDISNWVSLKSKSSTYTLAILLLITFGNTVYGQALKINEVHARSRTDVVEDGLVDAVMGDVNKDGIRVSGDEKFIELVNTSLDEPLNIDGWSIRTHALDEVLADEEIRHTFPESTPDIPAGGAIVVFSSGNPGGIGHQNPSSLFGGAVIQVASEGSLQIADAGAFIRLYNRQGELQQEMRYASISAANAGVSMILDPEITGNFPALPASAPRNHPDWIYAPPATPTARKFSPGVKKDGTRFATTRVKFTSTSAFVNEGAGTFNLPITILNPSTTDNTTFNLILIDDVNPGDNDDVNLPNYNAIPVIVPPVQEATLVQNIVYSLTINNDLLQELDEVLTFQIANAGGGISPASFNSATFSLTIADDDVKTVAFGSTTATVQETNADYVFQIPVKINGSSGNTNVTVEYFTGPLGGQTDVGGFVSQAINFTNGSSDDQIASITITNDNLAEEAEVIVFRLVNPGGDNLVALGAERFFTLTIERNDIPTVKINEICPFPSSQSSELKVDANGDLTTDGLTDEFIEVFNTMTTTIDVSGWKIRDSEGIDRFTFPSNPATVLQPGEAVVIFGGWETPNPEPAHINGVRIFFGPSPDENGLSLTNSKDQIYLLNSDNVLIDEFVYASPAPAAKSFTRAPDGTGEFTEHPDLASRFISPGLKQDGSVFNTHVKFALKTAEVTEGSGHYDLHVTILNPTNTSGNVGFELNLNGDGVGLGPISDQPYNVAYTQAVTDFVIEIPIIDNDNTNADKEFVFTIENVTGGFLPSIELPFEFTLTVTDDDVTRVEFASSSATVSENTLTFEIPVTISLPSDQVATSVGITLVKAEHDSDVDFESTLTFPTDLVGNQQKVVVTIINDNLIEQAEPIEFELVNPTGGINAVLGTNTRFTLTIEPSDIPSVIINEVLAWPSGDGADLAVDANGDGVIHALRDEMIELVHTGLADIDISGWKLSADDEKFVFPSDPPTILKPGETVVIFGGYSGNATRINGSRLFYVADGSGLSLSNTTDIVQLKTAANELVATYQYFGPQVTKSFTRPPDLSDSFALHPDQSGKFISPGLKSNGSYFVTQLNFATSSAIVDEATAGTYEIHVTCSSPLDVPNGTFEVFLLEGDPQQLDNFETQSRPIAPGLTDLKIPINIIDNQEITGPRTFTFGIQNVVGGVHPQTISPETFTLTIEDDDITSVSFDVESATVAESDGEYSVLVNIKAPALLETTVDVVLIEGSADDVDGFEKQKLIFPAGSGESAQVTFTVTDDAVTEADEILIFELQSVEQVGGSAIKGAIGKFTLTIPANDPALTINEIHGNPAPASIAPPKQGHGDANGNGTRESTFDEFIEFVNNADIPLDITGWVVKTHDDPNDPVLIRHTFPAKTVIPARGALVLFGGATPAGKFGGSVVQVCNAVDVDGESEAVTTSKGLLANDGSVITVEDAHGLEVAKLDEIVLTGITASLTRKPDISGPLDVSATHPLLGASYFSPGTKIDGSAFVSAVEFEKTTEVVEEGAGTYNLSFNLLRTNNEPAPIEFDVVLVSGDAADIGNFVPIHVVSGNSDTKVSAAITITDDTDLDPSEEFVFEIREVIGGFHPIALSTQFTLTIDDNDVTRVSFAEAGAMVREQDGTYTLKIDIANPSLTENTTAEIKLVSGEPQDINSFETVHLTFPAGSSDSQNVNILITDDAILESSESLIFEIQNVQGGILSSAGVNKTFTLTINDNDHLIVVNEYCPFPSVSGQGVDANTDGRVNGNEDEFIELVNTSGGTLDITGWKIVTGSTTRFTFPSIQLKAHEAIVVFGGWSTTAKGSAIKRIGKSRVLFASEGAAPNTSLGMTNTGATVEIKDASNTVQAKFEFVAADAVNSVSRVLSPDVTGSSYMAHPPLNGLTISPGLKSDGSPFIITTEVQFATISGGLYENDNSTFEVGVEISLPDPANATAVDISLVSDDPDTEITFSPSSIVFEPGSSTTQYISISINDDDALEGDEVFNFDITGVSGGNLAAVGTNSRFGFRIYDNDMPIIFNEVHAAPATDITGDANNDGTREETNDEFVELVNVTDEEIDMSGWKLVTGATLRHTFLPGTKVPPGKALVVFGGGIPVGLFGGSQYQISSEAGLGLSDNGQTIALNSELDELRSSFSYGQEGNIRQSLTRSPDITGYYVPHAEAPHSNLRLFSPGTLLNGMPFGDITTSVEPEVSSKTSVHPNPASSTITVSVADQKLNYDFILTDVHGRQVKAMRHQAGTFELDVRNLPDGMLVYRIMPSSGGRSIVAGKLWIQK